jgi:hypothetical protein
MSETGKLSSGSRLYVIGRESLLPLRHFFEFSSVLVISNRGTFRVTKGT